MIKSHFRTTEVCVYNENKSLVFVLFLSNSRLCMYIYHKLLTWSRARAGTFPSPNED